MLRAAGAAGAAAALAVTGLAVAPQAQAAVPRAAIDGAHPAWAAASNQLSRRGDRIPAGPGLPGRP